MASRHQTIDELIAIVASMGFEPSDCRLAVQHGKLTAEEIIDWIMAGKPGRCDVLKLQTPSAVVQNNGAQQPQQPFSDFSNNQPSAYGLDRNLTAAEEDAPLTSRMNRNEEQRKFKLRFEQKQREEAKKEALLERVAKKKAHEETLRRIQQDRENLKARSAPPASQPLPVSNTAQTSQPKPVERMPAGNSCVLQIRLEDGRSVKPTFTPETSLSDVKDFVQKTYCDGKEISLLQPFPRVEFGDADMCKTLKELGLVPNGSLVVKKSVKIATPSLDAPMPMDGDSTESIQDEEYNAVSDDIQAEEENIAAQVIQAEENIDEEGDNMEVDEESEDEDDNPPQHHFPGHQPGQPGPPIMGWPGGFAGGFGQAGHGQPVHNQHVWGMGNVLAGQVLENVVLPHHSKNPGALAAEAASQRFVTQPQVRPPSPDDYTLPRPEIPSLRDLTLKVVATQMCSARSRICGLQGIPENLASMILKTLVKERLLKPAILQMFISCRMQKIVLDSYPYCTNELIRAIRHHTYLKHLSLKSCSLITEKGLQSLTGLKHLKVMNLAGCVKISDSIVPIFSALTSLTALVLEDTSITDVGVVSYAAVAPPNLQILDLNRTKITEAIFPHLSNLPSLLCLNLEQTAIRSLSGIQGLRKLTHLNVANTQIVTESLLCLTHLSSLSSLNCANTPNVNGDVALSYLASIPLREFVLPNRLTTTDVALRYITGMKLTELDLCNFIYLTDESMQYVGQLKQLKKLLLANTKITDIGVQFLEGLHELEELNLDRTAVTNAIATSIQALTRLRELSLCNTGITNGFLQRGAVNQCRELTRLNISHNLISDKGIVCLKLPSLTTLKVDNTYIRPESLETVRTTCPLLTKYMFKTLLPLPRDTSDFD